MNKSYLFYYRGYVARYIAATQSLRLRLRVDRPSVKGIPEQLEWPEPDQESEAKAMIDAVIAKDFQTLQTIQRQYPKFEFGFESWLNEETASMPVCKKVLRKRDLRFGHTLSLEICQMGNGRLALIAALRRKDALIGFEELEDEDDPDLPDEPDDLVDDNETIQLFTEDDHLKETVS